MIDELTASFPRFRFFSEANLTITSEKLKLAGLRAESGRYLSFSLSVSLAIFLLSLLLFLLSLELLLALAFSLIAFALAYLFLLKLPSILAKRRGQEIETDLPIALRSIATELAVGISFEKCLAHAAKSGYSIAPEMGEAAREIELGGSNVPDALRGVALRVDSIIVKRAMQQMIEAYGHGSKGEGLRHLADELIEAQKAGTREHGARIAFLGLLFMAISCIVPALFQAYAVVGSAFLSSSFSASDIWLAYALGFPLAGSVVLIAIYEKTPKNLGRRKDGVLSKKQVMLADKVLGRRWISLSFRKILVYLVGAAVPMALFLLFGSFALKYEPWIALLPFTIPVLVYFFMVRKIEERTAGLEARLPDALLHASSFPKGTPLDKIIKSIADSGYGPLSLEFAAAHSQIKSGADVPSALRSISEENDSVLLSRATELLSQAYTAGGEMSRALKETADDMFSIFSIVRERESTLALQKYTLIFGGGLLVPLVLGAITNVISKLGGPGMELISSISSAERAGLISASIGAAQLYLVIYSLLASLFIAQLGGSRRNFIVYFVMMAPVSLLAYNLAMSVNVLG